MTFLIPENDALFGGQCHYRQWAIASAKAYGNAAVVMPGSGSWGIPKGLAEFRKVYVHDSPNGEPFERWCFEQWFHIADFMEALDVPVVFKADSDVLMFANLDEWYQAIGKPVGTKPACNCFITRAEARASADFILDTFRQGLQAQRRCEYPFSSDQTILHYRWTQEGYRDLCTAGELEPCADQNVMFSFAGWPADSGHKDITFRGGLPWQKTPSGERRLYNLHCWGRGKSAMANIWRQSRASLTAGPVRMEIL